MTSPEHREGPVVGVVILGASTFPHIAGLDNPAFARSAEAFRNSIERDGAGLFGRPAFLDLFDSPSGPNEIIGRIAEFLTAHPRLQNILFYYCGHGAIIADQTLCLLLNSTEQDREPFTGLPIGNFYRSLETKLAPKRVFILLDCCFAGQAVGELMTGGIGTLVESQVFASLQKRGTVLVAASAKGHVARAPHGEPYTLFTWALVDTIDNGIAGKPSALSFRDVVNAAREKIRNRPDEFLPTPEIHAPRQPDGVDISQDPFFANRAFAKAADIPRAAIATPSADAPLNALDPATGESLPDVLHCLVVAAELPPESAILERQVRLALESYSAEIDEAVDGHRLYGGRARRSQEDPSSGEKPSAARSMLSVAEAYASAEKLRAAVRAVCRADVAVFDITEFQPGVMFLLGVRSVARRGVTVCSHNETLPGDVQLPFNLQMLNIATHAPSTARGTAIRPRDLIGRKIVRGLKEMGRFPSYLDLPAYDPIRALGIGAENAEAIPRSSRVLILCPFGREYEARNWTQVVSEELHGKLKLKPRADRGPKPRGGGEDDGPLLVRLLDLDTPRLVAQTLYELIRRVDMCVVDWTGLRPNVMFELGVRLACNRLGAIHIAERLDSKLHHVGAMRSLFEPIAYSCDAPSAAPFRAMVDRFDDGLRPRSNAEEEKEFRERRMMDFLVYETVGEAAALDPENVALPVVEELVARARLFSNDDEESTGESPVLFHDVSPALRAQAQSAAAERRIAAWLYLDARHTDAEFAADPTLLREFRALSNQIRLWFNKQRTDMGESLLDEASKRINDRIGTRVRALQQAASAAKRGQP